MRGNGAVSLCAAIVSVVHFRRIKEKLEAIGLDAPSWTYKYNAGANPIGFAIPKEKATHSVIREILAEAYQLA